MAMIKCSDCGKDISDKAATCPGCGAPINEVPLKIQKDHPQMVKRSGGTWEGIGFLLIVGGMISGIAGSTEIGSLVMVGGFLVFLVGRFK